MSSGGGGGGGASPCIFQTSKRTNQTSREREMQPVSGLTDATMPLLGRPIFSSTSASNSITLPRYMLTHEITIELMLRCKSTFSQVPLKGGKTHRLIVPNNNYNTGNQESLLATCAIHKLLKILNHLLTKAPQLKKYYNKVF